MHMFVIFVTLQLVFVRHLYCSVCFADSVLHVRFALRKYETHNILDCIGSCAYMSLGRKGPPPPPSGLPPRPPPVGLWSCGPLPA